MTNYFFSRNIGVSFFGPGDFLSNSSISRSNFRFSFHSYSGLIRPMPSAAIRIKAIVSLANLSLYRYYTRSNWTGRESTHELLHEDVHATPAESGKQHLNENTVDALAYAVYPLMRDNPALVNMIRHQ